MVQSKNYFKLTKGEKTAIACICVVAPIYDLHIDFDRFPEDRIYLRKVAAIVIAYISDDLRSTALASREGMFDAGFGVLSQYVKKISVLL